MNIIVRTEKQQDFRETENVTREAFWDVYKPGCDEHLVLHNLRNADAFVSELDLVACIGSKIVGNIVYSRAKIINDQDTCSEVLCLGPICVLPEYQNKGIGSRLMRQTVEKAKELGYRAIILTGNSKYYERFGFTKARQFGIRTSEGKYVDYLLALELYDGSLKGIAGMFVEDEAFRVNKDELAAFDKEFPFKEKHVTDTQLKL